MRTFVILAVLAATTLVLMIVGGGLFPATVGIAALLLGGVALTLLGRAPRTTPLTALAPPPSRIPPLEAIAAAILLFVLFTALPLPPALDALAGPLRHQQNQAVVTALAGAAEVGVPVPESQPWFSLTRNRAGTLRYFLLLAAAFAAMTLTSSLSSPGRIGHLHVLAGVGVIVGVAGYLAQWKFPQGDTIWWYLPIPHAPTSPVGCFLNRNHFGGFVALLTPAALGLADQAFTRRHWLRLPLYLALTGLLMAIVFLSLSRGAMLALAAGLSVSVLLITFRRRKLWGLILIAVFMAGGGAICLKASVVRTRLNDLQNPEGSSSVQSRMAEWRESLRVVPHYPLAGAGMNALRMVYPQHRQTSVGARLIHAENEYIQLLAEGGLIGTSLAILMVLAFASRARSSETPLPEAVVVACSGALAVAAVHSLFDFPTHLPLYALALGSMAGLLLPPPVPATRRLKRLAMLPLIVAVTGSGALLCSHPASLKNMDDPAYLQKARYRDLHQALVWAPTSVTWLYLGHAMYREGATRMSPELSKAGETFMTQAALLDPQNYRLWYEVGEIRLALRDNSGAREAFGRAHTLRSWMHAPPIPEGP